MVLSGKGSALFPDPTPGAGLGSVTGRVRVAMEGKGSYGPSASIMSYLSMLCFLWIKALASLSLETLQMLKISAGGREMAH